MTEAPAVYKGLDMSTSTDTSEQEETQRSKNLLRDELIYQVDGESDSQQELIERLAVRAD